MADFQDKTNVARAGRVTGNRDLVTTNNVMKWTAQGKVFEAGHGIQTIGADSQAEASITPDDVKATFGLVAPGSATPLIVPIVFKCMWEVTGGALTDHYLIFTKAAGQCGTTLALSGRDMVVSNCMYAANPVKATHKASPLYGVATSFCLTVTALVDADAVMYDMTLMKASNIADPNTGSYQKYERYFLADGAPHILTSGAAMIFYVNSGTSDAVVHPYIQWAELEEADLV